MIDADGFSWELFLPWTCLRRAARRGLHFAVFSLPPLLLCFVALLLALPRLFVFFADTGLSPLSIPFIVPIAVFLRDALTIFVGRVPAPAWPGAPQFDFWR